MTSTIHHPVAVQSRGLIICEMEEESNEPKTILEIGGVSRPTYIIPTPTRPQPLPATINNQPYLGHWKAQPDIVPSPYPAFTEFQEQKIVRLSNANWSGALEKLQANSAVVTNLKGIFIFACITSIPILNTHFSLCLRNCQIGFRLFDRLSLLFSLSLFIQMLNAALKKLAQFEIIAFV